MSENSESQEEVAAQDQDEVTPEEISTQVAAIHQRIDEFKEWSRTVADWLEEERERLRGEGNHVGAAQTLQLIQHVDSVFLRIEQGDANLRPPVPEAEEKPTPASDTGEMDNAEV